MSAQKDFLGGLDLSSLSTASQEQTMQAINGLTPLANIGLVYASATRPDITNNARMIRYLWLDITDPANPVLKRYVEDRTVLVDADLSWEAVAVAAGAITTAMLAAVSTTGGVNLARLKTNAGYTDAGNALYVLRVAANGKDIEAVTVDTAIADAGGLALARLSTTGIGAQKYLGYSAGVLAYRLLDPANDITSALGNRIPIETAIIPGTANYFLCTNAAGTAPEWRSAANAFVINTLPINSLVNTGASANDIIRYSGSIWEKVTPTLRTTAADAINSGTISGSSIATAVHTIAHNLTTVPKLVVVRLRMTNAVADIGYNQNDEVDIAGYFTDAGRIGNVAVAIDATNVTVLTTTATGMLPNKTTGTYTGIDETKWFPVVYAWK
jgi:hypothetical protein